MCFGCIDFLITDSSESKIICKDAFQRIIAKQPALTPHQSACATHFACELSPARYQRRTGGIEMQSPTSRLDPTARQQNTSRPLFLNYC